MKKEKTEQRAGTEFEINSESIPHFFEKYKLLVKPLDNYLSYGNKDCVGRSENSVKTEINPYYLMKNEVVLCKTLLRSKPVKKYGDCIIFKLEDISLKTYTVLTNTYTYEICENDILTIRLKLIDFSVKIKEVKPIESLINFQL